MVAVVGVGDCDDGGDVGDKLTVIFTRFFEGINIS